jgi:hypothetical protein
VVSAGFFFFGDFSAGFIVVSMRNLSKLHENEKSLCTHFIFLLIFRGENVHLIMSGSV